MCLETINLRRDPDDAASPRSTERQREQPFYYWPFRYKTAIKNGKESGAGALPYFASVTYFIGVLAFGVGVIAEISSLPVSIASQVQLDTFLIGSLMFAAGGYIECLQNQVFTTLSLKTGWFGALFNFLGGLLFTAGAVVGWFDSYTSENLYGAGSLVYCFGSSLQIVMWKDEQFGLTFLTAINVSDKSAGAPSQNKDEEHRATFSALGCFFVHLWCFCGAMSVYNFNIELLRHYELDTWPWRSWQMAFNEFLPCLFAHMMLLLASAVMRTPTITPFREMHILVRVIGVLITANSTCTFFEFIFHDIRQ